MAFAHLLMVVVTGGRRGVVSIRQAGGEPTLW